MAKKTNKKRSNYNGFFQFIDRFYWIIPITTIISSLWFTVIIKYCGSFLKIVDIVDDEQKLNGFGIVLSIIIVALPVILSATKAKSDSSKQKEIQSIQLELDKENSLSSLLLKLVNGFSNLCDQKERRIVRSMTTNSLVKYDVNEQINNILKEMDPAVSFVLSQNNNRIKANDLYISLYYRFNDSEDWTCFNTEQKGLSTFDLINKKTTFSYLLRDDTPNYVFYNSKEDAKNQNRYVPDSWDKLTSDDKLSGSIAGYRFSVISNDKKYIEVMLFITTYSKPFANVPNNEEGLECIENAKNNLEEFVLKEFQKRIVIELGTVYLQQCNSTQSATSN